MTIQAKILCAIAVSGFAAFAVTSPAQALTAQECSAKYQAAKTAGTLGDQKWNDFRKAQCGADATPRPLPPRPLPPPPLRPPRRRKRKKEAAPGRCGACGAVRPRGLSERGGSEICQGDRRQGAHAHLRRPVQRQQDHQRQWRPEVDPEGRRLLQRMHQEAEGRGLTARRRRGRNSSGRV